MKNTNTNLSVERQLAELIDEVRVSVGKDATLAAKAEFDPTKTLSKFNELSKEVRKNIKEEYDNAISHELPQSIIDALKNQIEQFDGKATTFKTYLQELSSFTPSLNRAAPQKGDELSNWLDEVAPLPESEDFSEMPFQSLKADRTNVPRDFSKEVADEFSVMSRNSKDIDDFFLPEYLASKNETEITEDILAKAQDLDNSPVKIYEWVRNNVEWQPTWGGQQTADMTLDVRRGNAMDISTLMIALLRAAKIPARYIHGTVDIPADDFMNMAGDFESLDAATDFASMGGIPITSVTVGGKITKIRIEHVWVEAAVPFYPSRGAKPVSNRNPIDTWVPLDGSAKQYEYLHGTNPSLYSSIDINVLGNDFISKGIINDDEGWSQGLNPYFLDSVQPHLEKDLNLQIESMQNPTIGDVLGGRTIIAKKFDRLPGSLPYLAVVRGVSCDQLNNSLQVLVMLGLGYDRYEGNYLQQETWPLYQLNQRNIFISFKPANISDENALKALVPENVAEPNQLPNFFPSSIQVVPEIRCDSEILLSGNILALGEEIDVGYRFQMPTKTYFDKKDRVITGSYLALGIVGSNFSSKTFKELQNSLENTKNHVNRFSPQEIKNISRERLIGDTLSTIIYAYYANYTSLATTMGLEAKVNHHILPTVGTFGYEPYQRKLFGLNRGIETHVFYMNARVVQIIQNTIGDKDQNIAFSFKVGMLSSALEHSIPEQMFLDPKELDLSKRPNTISATKAILMALEQGQKIYQIDGSNKNTSLQHINHDSFVMAEIQEALAKGKTVITHTNSVQTEGWRGAGYIIFDAETGDGSYKIGGGKNGSVGQLFGFAGAIFGSIALNIGIGTPAGILMLFYTAHLMFINLVIALCTGEINLEGGMSVAAFVFSAIRANQMLIDAWAATGTAQQKVIALMAAAFVGLAAYKLYTVYWDNN